MFILSTTGLQELTIQLLYSYTLLKLKMVVLLFEDRRSGHTATLTTGRIIRLNKPLTIEEFS